MSPLLWAGWRQSRRGHAPGVRYGTLRCAGLRAGRL